MKKILMWLTVLALMLTGAAFADQENAPVMLVKLPEDAQMVENVAFDDGDFIQTYQLSGGAYVQLLRYMQSDVTIDGLVAGDWPGATNVQALDLKTVGGCAAQGVPRVHASASRAADGRLNLTAVNLSADEACDVRVSFLETELAACAGEILTGAIGAHNTFDAPQAVRPATYTDYERAGQGLTLHMPPVSVVQMTLTPR